MIHDHRGLVVEILSGIVVVARLRPEREPHQEPMSRFSCVVSTLGTAAYSGAQDIARAYWLALVEHVALTKAAAENEDR